MAHTFWHKTIKTEEGNQSSWKPKSKVWFQHNDDSTLGKELRDIKTQREAMGQARRDWKRMEGKEVKVNYYGIAEEDNQQDKDKRKDRRLNLIKKEVYKK